VLVNSVILLGVIVIVGVVVGVVIVYVVVTVWFDGVLWCVVSVVFGVFVQFGGVMLVFAWIVIFGLLGLVLVFLCDYFGVMVDMLWFYGVFLFVVVYDFGDCVCCWVCIGVCVGYLFFLVV